MTETKQISIPITGMTCANCVATVERNLQKVKGSSKNMSSLIVEILLQDVLRNQTIAHQNVMNNKFYL